MRRPQGFDRPRGGDAGGQDAPAPRGPVLPRRPGAPRRTSEAPAAAADRTGTEPIALVSTRFADPRVATPTAAPPADSEAPTVPIPDAPPEADGGRFRTAPYESDPADPGTVDPERADSDPADSDPADSERAAAAPESGVADASPASGTTGTARSARRAAAERRRYERAEVRRFTRRSRQRRLAWLVGGGIVVFVLGGSVAAAYSPLMALRDIRIEGASAVSADAVREALADELGTPLPLLDDERVHAAIAGFSLVERYSTELVPPGTLVVRIVERRAIGAIEGNGGWDTVDAAGVVMAHSDGPPEGQPQLDVPGGTASEAFAAAGAVVRSLPEPVRAALSAVAAESPDDVRLTLTGGAQVVWGDPSRAALKAAVLSDLMAANANGVVGQYDVSAPMSPVTR